jgi:hypothetical protein
VAATGSIFDPASLVIFTGAPALPFSTTARQIW